MKQLLRTICSLCLLILANAAAAQLYVDAGSDATICKGDSVTLGGTATVSAQAPFTYSWTPATGLSSTTIPNPVARPLTTTTYYLTSSDDTGLVRVDSVKVIVRMGDMRISASDTLVCPGRTILLSTNTDFNGCFATATCQGNNTSAFVGSDSIAQPGTVLQGPTLFGNYIRSNRSQMLYKASELQAVLGGPQVIRALTFWIRIFTGNPSLQNFTIKMGCTVIDSLTNWDNNLVTVYSASSHQPIAGFNVFILQTPFYWDGTSDIIIDVCNYNPNTFGAQNNKAACSQTSFKSYLHSGGNTNQCGGNTVPNVYTLRPNVRFNYCPNTSTPVPYDGYTYSWSASPAINLSTLAYPVTTATVNADGNVYLQVVDNVGCRLYDTVAISVNNAFGAIVTHLDEDFCSGIAGGSVAVDFNGFADSLPYWLVSSTYTDTLYSGLTNEDSIDTFTNLINGNYHLIIADSACGVRNYLIQLQAHPKITAVASNVVDNVYCYGDSIGGACVTVSGGTPPFSYLWDSIIQGTQCLDSLAIGLHQVLVTDVNGCVNSSAVFQINAPGAPINVTTNYVNSLLIVSVTGGIAPYTIDWGDNRQSPTSFSASHLYDADGMYELHITDVHGCETTQIVTIIGVSINDIDRSQISLYPNPANDKLFIQSSDISIQSVNIYNALGVLVMSSLLPEAEGVSVALLPSGAYVAEIKTTEGVVKMRWLKL
ncbi:MAG TPA: T9SS type A sorting domain-containing protein [Chitinophagales bacterium]|nr:T9SS type A sorting domain-containing protein [Chitinophagales bacterium]